MYAPRYWVCVVQHACLCILGACALDKGAEHSTLHGTLAGDIRRSTLSKDTHGSPIFTDSASQLREQPHTLMFPHSSSFSLNKHHNKNTASVSIGSKIKRNRLRKRDVTSPNNDVTSSSDNTAVLPGESLLSLEDTLALISEVDKQGACVNSNTVLHLSRQLPQSWTSFFTNQTRTAINTANILNNMFRAWDSAPTSLYNDAFFYSLLKGAFSGDRTTSGAMVAFDRDQYLFHGSGAADDVGPSVGSFAPYIRRGEKMRFVSLDLAKLKLSYTANNTAGYDWFWKQRKQFSDLLWDNQAMCDKVKAEDLVESMDSFPASVTTPKEGLWTQPYYDCGRTNRWVMTYSVPFFGCTQLGQLLFKGVVAVDVDISKIDINQCGTSEDDPAGPHHTLTGSHKCRNTTTCVFTPGHGFRLGGYKCECVPGYEYPGQTNNRDNFYIGQMVEDAHRSKLLNGTFAYDIGFQCNPCCDTGCHNVTPCYVVNDVMMRGVSVGVVSFCVSICLILAIVVLRLRKTKVMKASMWILLELILLGSVFLYSTVIIQYFDPNDITCMLVPWFREVGFAIVYGAIVLKIYRILSEFQSRKAHRVHVRDKDLLKYTMTIVVVVVGFMAAWTAVNLDYMVKDGTSLTVLARLEPQGLGFYMCREMWWDYVVEVAEFLLLIFGIYLCYRIRSAPSEYHERRFLSLAVYNETIVSTLMHIIRHFLWGVIHPDYIFLMYVIRCHLTVSLCITLVLGPKLWYAHRPPEDDHFRNRTYSSSDVHDNVLPESMKLHAGVNSNGDVDVTEINLSEMDPEDIRSELKRLYTQLQIYKTKTMRKDNPHISKRRGGRKQTHRRFSLQAFHHKHRHHHDHDHDHEMSKTPEESTNSAEGVAYSIEESTCSMGELSERRTPTVTFKPGHKSFY